MCSLVGVSGGAEAEVEDIIIRGVGAVGGATDGGVVGAAEDAGVVVVDIGDRIDGTSIDGIGDGGREEEEEGGGSGAASREETGKSAENRDRGVN